MSLELKKFNMRDISFKPNENKGPVVVLIGRRDTGKSFLVRDLLYYHQDIPIGTVISGTEAGNGFYSSHVSNYLYMMNIIHQLLKTFKTTESCIKTNKKRARGTQSFYNRSLNILYFR